ncbi:44506_t:CDS:1, partial [Gigaspora margarita]
EIYSASCKAAGNCCRNGIGIEMNGHKLIVQRSIYSGDLNKQNNMGSNKRLLIVKDPV